MSLVSDIKVALAEALKSGDKVKTSTLRLIIAAIKDHEISMRGKDSSKTMTKSDILGILARMIRQRKDSVKAYQEGGRLELAEREQQEIAIIESFMPTQLKPEEINKAIDDILAELESPSINDMGDVMKQLKKKYEGRMDFKLSSRLTREKLCSLMT